MKNIYKLNETTQITTNWSYFSMYDIFVIYATFMFYLKFLSAKIQFLF